MDENVVVEQTEQKEEQPVKAEPVQEKHDAELEKLKAMLSKANSQAAEYKKQLREKLSEAERTKAERAEQDKALREELETLRKEKAVSEYTAKCVSLKMDTELAAKTATAMADGDMNAVFDCLKQFVEATATRLNNEALNRQPGLSAGTPPTKGNTEDEITAQLRRYAGLPVHR